MTITVNNNWKFMRVYTMYSQFNNSSLCKLNLYSGTIPSSVDSWNPATYAGSLLASFSTFTMGGSGNPTSHMVFATVPAAVNASATGTITWFALYNSTTNACIAGVPSLSTGNGVLKVSTLDAVSGQSISVISFDLKAS